jgi:hypothetical protein
MESERRSGQERRVDGRVGGRRIDDTPELFDHFNRVLVAVSQQLASLLDRADLTQAAAAERADVHHDTLQRMLQTRTNFDLSSLVRATHALDAEVVITLVPRRANGAYKHLGPGDASAP